MNDTLGLTLKLLAFADSEATNDPRLKHADWLRNITGVQVRNPKTQSFHLAPGATTEVFSSLRATSTDATTEFSVSLLPLLGASRYRFAWTAGTNPVLRAGRLLAPTGMSLTFVANPNGTLTLQSSAPLFAGVVPGDSVFIPHITTGDTANLISVMNAGFWTVLSVGGTQSISLVRPVGCTFEGVSETVAIISNDQLRAFSAAGVQVGDSVDVLAGFSSATQSTFVVASVTDAFFEVVSTTPIPNETGILPGSTGLLFYDALKRLVYIECSQEAVVRVNGDTGNFNRLEPIDPSDPCRPGIRLTWGPTWSLVLVSRSPLQADVTVITCE
jgi:hypothetical protein